MRTAHDCTVTHTQLTVDATAPRMRIPSRGRGTGLRMEQLMDLMRALGLAIELMTTHGLYGRWRPQFDGARRRLGMCNMNARKIHFSRDYVTSADESSVRDTILHEIAHALAYERHGHTGHGPEWKRIALEIGCSGDRTGTNPAYRHLQEQRRADAIAEQHSSQAPTPGHLAGRLTAGTRVVLESPLTQSDGDVLILIRRTRNGYYRGIHVRTGQEWRVHDTRFRLHVTGEDLEHVASATDGDAALQEARERFTSALSGRA